MNLFPIFCFTILCSAITFFSFSFIDFEEHKEFPHICVMSSFQQSDEESFIRVDDDDDSSSENIHNYKLFKYNFLEDQQNNNNNKNDAITNIEDSIYFIHGNSGDHGQARWMFSEFSKLFWQETNHHNNDKKDTTLEIPSRVNLYTFSFNEEANIHSGGILERQVDFVVKNVVENQLRGGSSNNNKNNKMKKRCIWFLSHSMGGVVARVAAEELLSKSIATIDICGIFVLSSPQSKLPLHLDSKLAQIAEQGIITSSNNVAENNNNNKNHRGGVITGIIVSASNGAADIQVYENSVSKLNDRVRSEALVSFDLSTVTMAGLSTSHHGITYCHQLVRPLMKSLVWMMSVKRVTETLKSARHLVGGEDSSSSSSQSAAAGEPEMVSHIKRVLHSCFFSSSSPTMIGLLNERDADPKSPIAISTSNNNNGEDWLSQIIKNDYQVCSLQKKNNLKLLESVFDSPSRLMLTATKPFDDPSSNKKRNKKNKNATHV